MIFLHLLQNDPNWQHANKSFQGITRRFVLSMALLSCALVLLGLPLVQVGLALLAPAPFEYRNLPFEVCAPASSASDCREVTDQDTFKPGDVVPFIVDRCATDIFAKSAVLPYVVSRNVVNADSGTRIILPSLSTEIPAGGCDRTITVAHQLPESVAPGHYFLEGVATVYGRFRTVNAYFRTEVFTVGEAMTDCIDVSNYTDTLTPEALEAWKQDGVRLVIVQAVDPPPGYPAGKTRQQIQQCLDAGLAVDAYIWLWFDLGVADIQRKLTLLDGLPIRQLWLDVEDTAAAKYDQAACDQKVGDALAVCDSYPGTGRKTTGIYTGRWFWADRRYMNDSHYFAERPLWDSLYDDIQDTTAYTPYGGWQSCAIKQFHGTSTFHGVGGVDLNVLSESEAASLDGGNVTDPERQAYEDKINGLVSSLGYIGGDVLKPLTRKNAATYVKTAVEQIRGVCDQQGIAHA